MKEENEGHFTSLRSYSTDSVCKECNKKTHQLHKCPVCSHHYCEDHIYPKDHRCKVKSIDAVSMFRPIHFIGPILIFIVVAALIAYGIYSSVDGLPQLIPRLLPLGPKTVNKTVYEDVPLAISFEEYLDNIDEYHNAEADIIGFLTSQKVGNGYFSYVIDDYNRKISLSIMNRNVRNVFKESDPTLVYQVKGIFRRRQNGLYIDVNSITLAERLTKKVAKTIIVEE